MKKLLLTLTLAASLLSVSCAKEKAAPQETAPIKPVITEPVQPGVVPTGTGFGTSGGFAELSVDTQTFENFLTRPTNNVSDIKINLDLTENSDGTFSGKATIYFEDRNQTNFIEFHTGGQRHSQYNRWINDGRQFHAVFDDFDKGMLVVSIDQVFDFGDGEGHVDLVDGSVFYSNYNLRSRYGVAPAKHPQFYGADSYCWEITAGPYECNPWGSLSQANTQIWPDSNMKLLGRYTGLSLDKAFNFKQERASR